MEYKVSIIIPVYGVEKYLEECLDSVINQTYSNLEIILIDDESPDQCPVICDEYALKDNRIKVIHKKNGGAGSARNAGLKICTGEYICFVDSDDYVYPNYVEKLVSEAVRQKAEIIVSNFDYLYQNKKKTEKELMKTNEFSSVEYLEEFLINWNCSLIWNKIFKKDILKSLFFVEGRRIDDEFFTYQAVIKAKKIVQIEDCLYVYRMRKSSVMNSSVSRYEKMLEDQVDYFTERYDKVTEKYPELKKVYLENLMDNMIRWKRQSADYPEMKQKVKKIICFYRNKILFGNASITAKYIFIRNIWFSNVIESVPIASEEDNQNLFD